MAQATVKTEQIADGAITAAKIADGAIVAAELASNSVTTAKIADDAVTSAKLDTNIAIAGTLDVAGAVVFNEGSADVDFRVESNGSANMLFVDGGNNEVLVQKAASGGTATAGSVLIVEGDDNTELSILGGSSSILAINFGHSGDVDDAIIGYNTTSGSENMAFTVNAAERMRLSGNNLHLNGGTDARIQLGSGGAGANSTSNDTVHIRGDGDDMKLMAAADGNYIFEVNGSEKVRITSGGSVQAGSGASISPDADADNLVIQENGAAGITIGSSASSVGSIRFADSGSPRAGMIYYNHVGNEMRFYTGATERMRIASNGFLGLGTTSPASITGAAGPVFDMKGSNPEIVWHDDAGTANAMSMYYINDHINFYSATQSASAAVLYSTGNLTITGSLAQSGSDERIKNNITPISNATDKLKTLRGVEFDWDEDVCPFKGHEVGLIAQEVEKIIPSAIKPAPFDVDDDGNSLSGKDYKTIQYNKIVPLLVQTIKELEARIKTLEDA